MLKVGIHNLGCKVNGYESEEIIKGLTEKGYGIVPFEDLADIYIVNTCSVTSIADAKSRQMLHRAKKLNPRAVVVALGCYVQTSPKEAENDVCVDLAVGNDRKKELIPILEEFLRNRDYDVLSADGNKEMSVSAGRARAYLKIQDGCDNFCSYCIIPYARGRVRSLDLDAIAAEAGNLARSGCLEIVITGIHISSYGLDLKKQGLDISLIDVIERICNIREVKRVRLGSLEPRVITEEFVSAIRAFDKLCPHFHLSLQSGSDSVLERMNRKYNADEYMEKVELLRRYYDNPSITTDVIVGFPNESDSEFEETLSFVKKAGFADVHVFRYSRRKGTKAADMGGQVSGRVKADRSKALIDVTKQCSMEYLSLMDDKQVWLLTEEVKELNGAPYAVGHTERYISAKVPVKPNEDFSPAIIGGIIKDNIFHAEV